MPFHFVKRAIHSGVPTQQSETSRANPAVAPATPSFSTPQPPLGQQASEDIMVIGAWSSNKLPHLGGLPPGARPPSDLPLRSAVAPGSPASARPPSLAQALQGPSQ